ncbi:MAG TPA: hypothetical protein DEP38_15255 [Cyanobacteria bacterium UBA9226]|nr:hypothetical protein [Cyanobacteria bacterium UBA9226]
MTEFVSSYHEILNSKIEQPHRIRLFELNKFVPIGRFIRFQELAYTGNEENITLYWVPSDDRQIKFVRGHDDETPITGVCYCSINGVSKYQEAFRLLVCELLKPLTIYQDGELALDKIIVATELLKIQYPISFRYDYFAIFEGILSWKIKEKPDFLDTSVFRLFEPFKRYIR